jgi:hypothetical protein
MVRRDFLKLSGLLSTAVFMQFNPLGKAASLPVAVGSQGKYYRAQLMERFMSLQIQEELAVAYKFWLWIFIFSLVTNYRGQVQAQLGFES